MTAAPRRPPDTVVVNGRITTLSRTDGPAEVEALAIHQDRVSAVGSTADIAGLAGPHTRRIDAAGLRVVPGLIDSHVHVVRAGLTWDTETRWEQETTLAGALDELADLTAASPAGRWIRVIGGWHPEQFGERRGPTREELDRVAPDHPVYVQCLYDWALLNSAAISAMDLNGADLRELGTENFEYDADGSWTGKAFGMPMMKWFYRRMPTRSFEQQVASTASLSRDLNRMGITGVIDGGGVNTGPDAYAAIYEAWRRGLLTVRTRLMLHASDAGREQEEFDGYRRYTPRNFGDEMLRVLGAGEVILYRSHDRVTRAADTSKEAREHLRRLFAEFARDGWTVHMHVHQHELIEAVLDAWESVDDEIGMADLRWALVHGESLTQGDLSRMRRLGAGLLTQGLFRFAGDGALDSWGRERVAESPPLRALRNDGVPVGLGSDATRVAGLHPFINMEWYTSGTTLTGAPTLAEHNLLSREQALRGYSADGAWFSFEDSVRGRLEPGLKADLAVLTSDYLTVPSEEVSGIESALTLVGGRVVHAGEQFSDIEPDAYENAPATPGAKP